MSSKLHQISTTRGMLRWYSRMKKCNLCREVYLITYEAQKIGRCAKCQRADQYGNLTPVQIEEGEWWFNGCFIQSHPIFPGKFRIWPDNENFSAVEQEATSFKLATEAARELGNQFSTERRPSNYL